MCSEEAWNASTTLRGNRGIKKSVSFADGQTLISVPDRHDLDRESYWWSGEDINAFRADAFREVRDFMSKNAIFDGKYALQLMYQPEGTIAPLKGSALDILFYC